MIILFSIFFLLLIAGVPVAFCLFSSSVIYMLMHDLPVQMAAAKLVAGPDSFPLLAIAFFVLAGAIMNSAGITKRIFAFAEHLVGHLTGGLGHANVLASIIFSGMSGSAAADVGGLGAIELQAMKEAGYDEDFSLAVTGGSSIIGPIIPPSIPAVVFGVASGVSIGRLFVGGIIPGFLMAIAMSILIYFQCRKRGYEKKKMSSIKVIAHSFVESFFPLMTPVIIMGGIMGGVFTPTEAAIIAVFYALILGFAYKSITVKDLPRFLIETLNTTIGILFIIASATLFAWVLTISQFPQHFAETFMGLVSNKYIALFLLNLFLLVVGCFMETTPAQMILVPILLPIFTTFGVDPVHFGIIMILNLMIGLMTPPLGLVLYVLSSVSKVSIEQLSKTVLPYVVVIGIVLLFVTYIPALVLTLPNLIYG